MITSRIGAVRCNPRSVDRFAPICMTRRIVENGQETWASFGPIQWTIPDKEVRMPRRNEVWFGGLQRYTWNYEHAGS